MKKKIKQQGIKCTLCGDEIYSNHRHDFKYCKCGAVAIDGGADYTRIIGNDYTEIERDAYLYTPSKEEKDKAIDRIIRDMK